MWKIWILSWPQRLLRHSQCSNKWMTQLLSSRTRIKNLAMACSSCFRVSKCYHQGVGWSCWSLYWERPASSLRELLATLDSFRIECCPEGLGFLLARNDRLAWGSLQGPNFLNKGMSLLLKKAPLSWNATTDLFPCMSFEFAVLHCLERSHRPHPYTGEGIPQDVSPRKSGWWGPS